METPAPNPVTSVEMEVSSVLPPEDDSSEDVSPLRENMPDEDSPCITWTIYIALAFPAEACKERAKGKGVSDRACYHVEYKLLPGDTETTKLDLLLYGTMAKLHTEEETKILKTWTDAGQTWVGWSQDFSVRVNKAVAIGLLSHRITVHIWNLKDKLLGQAPAQSSMSLRLTWDQAEDSVMTRDVESMVTKLRSLCQSKCPEKLRPVYHSTPKLGMAERTASLEADNNSVQDPKSAEASIHLSPVVFLADELSLVNWALVGFCGISESLIHISLEKPLLSDQLKAELNPLTVTIVSATSMPSTPMPFQVLEENCSPVYCQYQFQNLEMHKTRFERHGSKIFFRDVNVIFAGLLNPQDLHDFLLGPPMKIEIHDRERKPDDQAGLGGGLSGVPSDATLKRKTHEFNYHGVARLNLSDLLLGKTYFKGRLPIKRCSLLPPKVDTAHNLLIQPGHYCEANSELKVMLKLAYPLHSPNIRRSEGSFEAQICRMVYIFHRNNTFVMDKLRMEILTSNAQAFGLCANTENAFFNHKAIFKANQHRDLDYVSGFHLVDKKTQVLVVEGLKHKAVRRLWSAVSMKMSESKEEQVVVLYNSSLAFFKRIYDTLDLGLTPIVLPEPLEMLEPLIYVGRAVPPACLQGLSRLKQLCQVTSLKDAVHYDLFPSAEMIQCLRRKYKTQPELRIQTQEGTRAQTPAPVKSLSGNKTRNTKVFARSNISHHYDTFRPPKDFIQENIRKVQEDSARIQKPATTLRLKLEEGRPAHNYSIQTFNTNELNKRWLQAQMPGWRQEHHSATIEPGENATSTQDINGPPHPLEVFDKWSLSEVRDTADERGSRYDNRDRIWDYSAWRPDMHPPAPDHARVEELRKPWRENILHENILTPPLSRGPWGWSQRSQDFQLYKKATPFFSTPSVSLHTPGKSLQEEQTLMSRVRHSHKEEKKLFVNRGTGSAPEVKCHVAGADKFQDFSKDKASNYPLRKSKPVPLSVISRGADATEAPGPSPDFSLSSRSDSINRPSAEFHNHHNTI